MIKRFFLMIVWSSLSICLFAQSEVLRRKAKIAMGSRVTDSGLLIVRVDPGGTIEKAGLSANDLLVTINHLQLRKDAAIAGRYLTSLREGDTIHIEYLRNGQLRKLQTLAVGLPKETSVEYEIIYGAVNSGTGKLRTLTRKPYGTSLMPAVLFIDDFPCWSVDVFKRYPVGQLMESWVKAGFCVITVEKTGLGDNENTKSCEEAVFSDDISSAEAGYRYMKGLPFVDTSKLFIFGKGNGAAAALAVAVKFQSKGLVMYGTNYRPWSEYWFDRLRYHALLQKKDLATAETNFKNIHLAFDAYFNSGKSMQELYNEPGLRNAVQQTLEYDPKSKLPLLMQRNPEYWREYNKASIPEMLTKFSGYVLSLRGSMDAEGYSDYDHLAIADVANTYFPGHAKYLQLPNIEHSFYYDSENKSDTLRGKFNPNIARATIEWFKEAGNLSNGNETIVIPRDTSLVDMKSLALQIIGKATSSFEKVKAVIEWANKNLEWTATDYVNRTASEILCKRGGNCNEEKKVVAALLGETGVQVRTVREINIQPESITRKASAARLIESQGNAYSVFGLRHNDHVWIEFYDEQKATWEPADPTTGLVGLLQWLQSRIGFAQRPMHSVLQTKDMLVPIAIFTVNEKTGVIDQSLSKKYLTEGFNAVYGNRLSKLAAWKDWQKIISLLDEKAAQAFMGRSNLHEQDEEIRRAKLIYEQLKLQYLK